MCFNIEISILD